MYGNFLGQSTLHLSQLYFLSLYTFLSLLNNSSCARILGSFCSVCLLFKAKVMLL